MAIAQKKLLGESLVQKGLVTEEQLQETLAETERFNRLMTGREERIIEMKKEVNALPAELGREPQYKSVLKDEDNEVISAGNSL